MDPATLAMIMAGLGGLSDIIGSPGSTIGDPSDVTNINEDQTNAMLEQLTAILNQTQGQTDQFAGQASGAFNNLTAQGNLGLSNANQQLGLGYGNLNQSFNNINTLRSQIANQPGYNPQDATDLFQQNIPIYQDLANQARQEALGQFETPATSQALLSADRNVSSAANQFAGLGASTSGAAAAAAAQGAQAPLAQLAVDRANLANQSYLGTLNPLLQQGQGLASQQSQFGYNAGVQSLLQQLSAAGQAGQLGLGQVGAANQGVSNANQQLGQGAQGLLGLSSLYAGLQSGALSGLTDLSQPEYFTPTYTPDTGLFGIFG
jgi:hypothetical protein